MTRRHSLRAHSFRCFGQLGIVGRGFGSLVLIGLLPGFPRSSFRRVGVGGGPDFIRVTLLNQFSFPAGESLPPGDRHVHESRFELDRVAAAPELFGCDELRSAAAERFIAKVARYRVQQHRHRE